MSSSDLSALEASLAVLNILLDWAIAFVVIGLILEYSPKFWSRLTHVLSDRFIEKTGEVLVILGVAGELGMHIWSAQIEDKIKSNQRDKIIALDKQLVAIQFPRRLNPDKLNAGIEGIGPQFFEVLYDPSAADANGLAFNIFVALHIAGWKTDQKLPAPLAPRQGPSELKDVYPLLPLTQQAGGQAWGLGVVSARAIDDDPRTKTPENALANALLDAVSSPIQTVSHGRDETMPSGKIRIIVGPKLP